MRSARTHPFAMCHRGMARARNADQPGFAITRAPRVLAPQGGFDVLGTWCRFQDSPRHNRRSLVVSTTAGITSARDGSLRITTERDRRSRDGPRSWARRLRSQPLCKRLQNGGKASQTGNRACITSYIDRTSHFLRLRLREKWPSRKRGSERRRRPRITLPPHPGMPS